MKTTQKQIQELRVKDLQLSAKIDKQETKKEQKLTFSDFCKKLEYRREAVYFKGSYLFKKVSNKINQLNEVLFYDLFNSGQLNY